MSQIIHPLISLQAILPLETFQTDAFAFQYPVGGAVTIFERAGISTVWRILVNVKGSDFFIDIQKSLGSGSMKSQADEIFTNAHPAFEDENIAPFLQRSEGIDAWRTCYHFVDGAKAPLMIDSAVVGKEGGLLFLLQYAAAPELYPIARPVFDTLISTFRLLS